VGILWRLDPQAALAYVERVLGGGTAPGEAPVKLTPSICQVIAEAALAAKRPDKALEAARKARELAGAALWVCRLEARALLDAGRPADAAEALRARLDVLPADPESSGLYVRALAAAGTVPAAEEFLADALKRNAVSAALAGADALAKEGELAAACRVLRRVITHEPRAAVAQFMLGDCLRQQAEQAPGGWDRGAVDEAMRAYAAAKARAPKNLQLVNNIAWLELTALGLPRQAYDTAAPLRAAPADDLPPEMLETVGATHLAVGEYEPARAALEKAAHKVGTPPASTYAFLAMVYHHLGRGPAAQECLRRAQELTKSSPREYELVEEARRRLARG
jgi:tetratricopeptide (TPR) repeat protein